MTEGERIQEILMSLAPEERLFRINSGMGWTGKIAKRTNDFIMLENPRPLHAAPEGWPDLCGWKTIEITPDMVGKKVAVFIGVEVKVTGSLRPKQRRFRDIIEAMGGLFKVVK